LRLWAGSAWHSESCLAVTARRSQDRVRLELEAGSRGRRERAMPWTVLSNACACISLTQHRCSCSLMGVGSSGGRGSVSAHLNALLCELPYLPKVLQFYALQHARGN
jgi:hypothetical protein